MHEELQQKKDTLLQNQQQCRQEFESRLYEIESELQTRQRAISDLKKKYEIDDVDSQKSIEEQGCGNVSAVSSTTSNTT